MAERFFPFVKVGRLSRYVVCLAVIVFAAIGPAVAQPAPETKPTVSDKPLTAEQLAVYRKALTAHFLDDNRTVFHLASKTVPYALDDKAGDCAKKIGMAKIDSTEVHRFRKKDLPQLGLKVVDIVDLGTVRRRYVPLVVSEIRFDDKHESAMVWVGEAFDSSHPLFGSTVLLEMKDGVWQERIVCTTWIR